MSEVSVGQRLSPQSASSASALELTIVVPTFNEAENVALVVDTLHSVLDGFTHWEVVFVDDNSPDGTAEMAKKIGVLNPKVRCIHRIGRRGLSTACIEGALASSAEYVAVMDGDLQHDANALKGMLQALRSGGKSIAVGTRYVEGGNVGDWSGKRLFISQFATRLAQIITKVKLSDPMSGFFMVRRTTFNDLAPNLSGMGFKILLDLFMTAKSTLTFHEEPYTFATRRYGESKLDSQVVWDFLMMLGQKQFGKYIPVKFLSFALIGSLGVLIHLIVFIVMFEWASLSFMTSKIVAVVLAMISNYTLNNALTYRDTRRVGMGWLTGLLSFSLICSIGSAADVGISSYIYNAAPINSFLHTFSIIPALAGVLIGAVWNYAVSSAYTWKKK